MMIGGWEVVVLMVIGLIVLGPEKLPEVAKKVARAFRDFRRYTDDMRREIDRDLLSSDTPNTRTVQPKQSDVAEDEETDDKAAYGYGSEYSEDDPYGFNEYKNGVAGYGQHGEDAATEPESGDETPEEPDELSPDAETESGYG